MPNTPNAYDLVIGLDRSDRKADLSLIETASGEHRSETVNSAPEALRQWLLELRQRHRKATVAICLEQPAGHLIPFATSPPSIRVLPCGFNWSVASCRTRSRRSKSMTLRSLRRSPAIPTAKSSPAFRGPGRC